MFRNFRGICSSASIKNQVSPITFRAGDYVEEPSDSNEMYQGGVDANHGIKNKPKVDNYGSSSSKKHALSDELFMFVIDINASVEVCDSINFMMYSNKNSYCYTYKKDSDLSPTSVLVLILRNTAMEKSYINNSAASSKGGPYGKLANERRANLLHGCNQLIDLLNSYQEYPRDYDNSTPYNGNPFTSVEKALIVADIFIRAVIDYVSTSADRVKIEESLNAHLRTLLDVIQHFGKSLILSENDILAHLWAQLTSRCCCLIFYLVHVTKTTTVSTTNNKKTADSKQVDSYIKNLSELVNIVHAVGAAVTQVKMYLGSTSSFYYTCSVMFWEACHRVLLLLKSKSFQLAIGEKNTTMDPRFFRLCSELMNTFYATLPTTFEVLQEVRSAVEKDCNFDMRLDEEDYNLFTLLVESGAFHHQTGGGLGRSNSIIEEEEGGNLLFALQRPTVVTATTYDHPLHSNVTGLTTHSTHADDESGGVGNNNMIGDLTPNTPHCGPSGDANGIHFSQLSFRMRYICLSIQYLLRMSEFRKEYAIRSNPSSKLVNAPVLSLIVPFKHAWIVTLAECLLTVLSPPQNGEGQYHSSNILALGPHFADLLMKVLFGSIDSVLHPPHVDRLDAIFWEIARHLGIFTDILKRRLRSLTDNHGRRVHTVASAHSASSMSLRTNGSDSVHKQRNNHVQGPTTAVFSLSLDTPAKDAAVVASSSVHLPLSARKHRSNTSSPAPKLTPHAQRQPQPQAAIQRFEINDIIDGQCELPNGSKRWFPGKIISVNHTSNTYSIHFNDGDIATNKSVEDIRFPKKRTSNASTDSRGVRPAPLALTAEPTIAQNHSLQPITVTSIVTVSEEVSTEKTQSDVKNQSFVTPIKTSLSAFLDTSEVVQSPDIFVLSPFSEYNPHDTSSFKTVPKEEKAVLQLSMSIKSVQCDEDPEGDDESCFSDDDHVYEIPSVFEGGNARIANIIKGGSKNREDIVPLMRFDDLNMTAALPQTSSGLSLSGTLVSSEQSFRALNMSGRQPVSASHFHLNLPHKTSNHYSSKTEQNLDSTGRTSVESARTSDRTNAVGFRPLGPPSDAHLASSLEITGRKHSKQSDHKFRLNDAFADDSRDSYADGFLEISEATVSILKRTFGTVCVILLERCIVDNASFLDQRCCASQAYPSPAVPVSPLAYSIHSNRGQANLQQMSVECAQTNLLFNVRDFLEVSQNNHIVSNTAELCMQHSDALLRLCKLLHIDYFKNCLPHHMDNGGVKIGDGGFGSVFRVSCTDSCGGFKQYKNCLSCYRNTIGGMDPSRTPWSGRCVCWHASHHSNNTHTFAVKRIGREKSAYDTAVVMDIFNEISALESLSNNIGVCGLEDYGVHGSEYWLVMENGGMNLLEWRLQAQSAQYAYKRNGDRHEKDKDVSVRSNKSDCEMPMTLEDMTIYLALFLDILLIVKSVHAADIAHYDIKCNNFVLRDDPRMNVQYMHACHVKGKASGIVFLADFGEAVCHVNQPRIHPVKAKCRGTITIQSPEMLVAADNVNEKLAIGGSTNSSRTGFRGNTIKSASVNSSSGSLSALPVNINSPNELHKMSLQPAAVSQKGRGRKVFVDPDTRSDIWSVGCLLYELLTSQQLFAEKTWVEMYVALCMETFTPVVLTLLESTLKSLKSKDMLKNIGNLIQGALRQDAEQRNTVDIMIVEVERIMNSRGSTVNGADVSTADISLHGNALSVGGRRMVESNSLNDMRDGLSPTSSLPSPEDNMLISKRFMSLREQYSTLNISHLHMGHSVYLTPENTSELLAYFDRHHTIVHTSRDPFNLDPTDICPNVLRTFGSVDMSIHSSCLSRTVNELGRAVAHRQLKLDGSLIWIRISSQQRVESAHTARGREKLFDKFVKKGGKICATHTIYLNEKEDLNATIDNVQKTLNKVTSQYVHGQSVVVVSVDSIVLSADMKCSLEQSAGQDHSSSTELPSLYFDKQCISVGAAFCGLLTSWVENHLENSHTTGRPTGDKIPQSAVCLDRLVQLWRCMPWFESSCSQEIVDCIIRTIHQNSSSNS